MKTITTTYVLIGCKANCAHRLADTTTEEIHTAPRRQGHPAEKYISQTISPGCSKAEERGILRQSIYGRADAAKDNAIRNGKSWKSAVRAWEKIATEWRGLVCPFFMICPSHIEVPDLQDMVSGGLPYPNK